MTLPNYRPSSFSTSFPPLSLHFVPKYLAKDPRSCVQLIALGSSFFSYSYIKASTLTYLTHLQSLFKAYIPSSSTPSVFSARNPTSLQFSPLASIIPYPKSINNATHVHFPINSNSHSSASKPISFANTASDSTSRRCDLA